ncbi:MAG TPA: hypothetical protein VH351_12020 [Bryobacteraceae bacterium]|jgi:hypothetical protein|nr:hypothetical protein [Bryobacteraceae bacterium]
MIADRLRSTFNASLMAMACLALFMPCAYSHDLKVCKTSDPVGPVSGSFRFTVGDYTFDVGVGYCHTISAIGTGTFNVIEKATPNTIVSAIVVSGAGTAISTDTTTRSATVTVVEGGTTTVTFTNRATVNGRFTGGGSIFTSSGVRVTHGFELHCSTTQSPNNLEINFAQNSFHLTSLTSVACSYDTTTGVATITGTGTGLYNGAPGASIAFTFTDAGEPGTSDFASYVITDASGTVLNASGDLTFGNQQFHPAH